MTEFFCSTFQRTFTGLLLATAFMLVTCTRILAQDPVPIDPPVKLDGNVNSEYAELVPVASPDGKRLYFIRKYSPDNVGGEKDADDIYYSEKQADGSWGKAVNIGAPLNTPGSDALLWISEDGKTALVHNGKKINGVEMGLAISHMAGGKWGQPKKISIQGLEDLGEYYQATITPDREFLIISRAPAPEINNYNFDLFYCKKLSDDMLKWGEPVPFDNGINSPFAESAPFVGPDNRTLYFATDRPGGYGSGDIYTATRIGDNWTQMTYPKMMGEEINTPYYETGLFMTYDRTAFFVGRISLKEIDGYGKTDIFYREVPETLSMSFNFVLEGKLVDRNTGKGIAGSVTVSLLKEGTEYGRTTSAKDGSFEMVLSMGHQYKLAAKASGYTDGGTVLDFRRKDPGEEYDLTVQLVKESGTSTIANSGTPPTILFQTGSATLSAGNKRSLQRFYKNLAPQIRTGTISQLRVTGYTDSTGTDSDNQRLSQERAQAVRNALVELGVPPSIIVVEGRGENSPTGNNGTVKGRAANRRVEISL